MKRNKKWLLRLLFTGVFTFIMYVLSCILSRYFLGLTSGVSELGLPFIYFRSSGFPNREGVVQYMQMYSLTYHILDIVIWVLISYTLSWLIVRAIEKRK